MKSKLYRSKFYIVDLHTKQVDTEHAYPTMTKALDAERQWRPKHKRYTALSGAHILAHEGHPWIVPDLRYLDEIEKEFNEYLATF